jgi:hypothetical protein
MKNGFWFAAAIFLGLAFSVLLAGGHPGQHTHDHGLTWHSHI